MPDTADLLEEIAALKAMLIDADARDLRKDERIARLEKLVAAFRQAVFGRRSEKSDPNQFELALEDLETAMAEIHAEEDAEAQATKRPVKPRAANRGSLRKHLPRIEEIIGPESLACACGSCLHCIGEEGEAITTLVRVMAERTARHRARAVPRHRHPPPQNMPAGPARTASFKPQHQRG
jgi:transposase